MKLEKNQYNFLHWGSGLVSLLLVGVVMYLSLIGKPIPRELLEVIAIVGVGSSSMALHRIPDETTTPTKDDKQ